MRDRWFESISLQGRVCCELDRSMTAGTAGLRGDAEGAPMPGERVPTRCVREILAPAEADRGDKGDLDQGDRRISWRVRQFPNDADVAQAGPEAAPADYRWRRLSACGAAGHPLRRWLGADCWPDFVRRRQ